MNHNKGLAFPVGVSVNNCVAHDSSCIVDDRKFKKGDVVKFDFGTQLNGNKFREIFSKIFILSFKFSFIASIT
jgi:methionyl aminopeptidase